MQSDKQIIVLKFDENDLPAVDEIDRWLRGGFQVVVVSGDSDLTALSLAQRLGGACRLIKNVDGLYTGDPNANPSARRFARVSYATAARVGGAVVQRTAIDFAQRHHLKFTVSSVGSACATEVGPYAALADLFDVRHEWIPNQTTAEQERLA
jgi:hypothetical protein